MADSREQMDRLLKDMQQEAYARGYAAAIAAVTAAAAAAAPKAPESPAIESPPSNGAGAVTATLTRGRGRPSTAIASVREAIFEKPGMKGVELVRYLEQRGTPVGERTVRSCLRRLKGQDARQRRHRWYPIDGVESRIGEVPETPPH